MLFSKKEGGFSYETHRLHKLGRIFYGRCHVGGKAQQGPQHTGGCLHCFSGQYYYFHLYYKAENNYYKLCADYVGDKAKFRRDYVKTCTNLFNENFQKATQAMLKAASNMEDSSKNMETTHKTLTGQINRDLNDTMEIFDQNMRSVIKQLGNAVNDISASVENLPHAVGSTSRVFEQQLGDMADTLRRAQATLDDAVARMR